MPRMKWDQDGERKFEAGVENVAIALLGSDGYGKPVPWNGCTAFNEQPQGGEATKIYADNRHYLTLYSAETVDFTVEAYTYPDEFKACNGELALVKGVTIGQQTRKAFGAQYVTLIGNDIELQNHGKKIHVIYGCRVSPSEKGHSTINENLETSPMSWNGTTSPVEVEVDGEIRTTATLEIDSTEVGKTAFDAVYAALYGSDNPDKEPAFLMPDEILAIVQEAIAGE